MNNNDGADSNDKKGHFGWKTPLKPIKSLTGFIKHQIPLKKKGNKDSRDGKEKSCREREQKEREEDQSQQPPSALAQQHPTHLRDPEAPTEFVKIDAVSKPAVSATSSDAAHKKKRSFMREERNETELQHNKAAEVRTTKERTEARVPKERAEESGVDRTARETRPRDRADDRTARERREESDKKAEERSGERGLKLHKTRLSKTEVERYIEEGKRMMAEMVKNDEKFFTESDKKDAQLLAHVNENERSLLPELRLAVQEASEAGPSKQRPGESSTASLRAPPPVLAGTQSLSPAPAVATPPNVAAPPPLNTSTPPSTPPASTPTNRCPQNYVVEYRVIQGKIVQRYVYKPPPKK